MENPVKYIKKIEITHLWNDSTQNFEWNLKPDVNVLAGDNGSGKSTILKLVSSFLNSKEYSQSFKRVKITLNTDFYRYVECEVDGIFMNFNQRNHLLDYIKTDYIATFDQKLKASEVIQKIANNKEVTTELDWQIDQLQKKYLNYQIDLGKKIMEALRSDDKSVADTLDKQSLLFKQIVNKSFKGTHKVINNNTNELSFLKEDKPILVTQLSAGEKQLLIILLTVLVQDEKPAVLFLDEPELSLHIDWQETLIDSIRALNPSVQLIIVTHPPYLIAQGWASNVFEIDDIKLKI